MEELQAFFLSEQFAATVEDGKYFMVGMIAAHIAAVAFVWLLLPSRIEDKFGAADNLLSIPLYSYLSYLAIKSSWECHDTLEKRWSVFTDEQRIFLWLYVCRSLVHNVFMFFIDMKPSHRNLMVAHHLVSLCCFFMGLYTRAMGCFGLLDGICEVSTFFLSVVFFLKDMGWDKTLPTAFALSGFGLWLSYIFCRLLLFPYWLYLFFTDITTHPERTWNVSNSFQRYIYPSTTILLLCLSIYWMIPVTKGFIKAVSGSKSKPAGKKE